MVMTPQSSAWPSRTQRFRPRCAAAEEVVAGEDGDGWNGGEDVAGEFGLREGEKDDGDERPENQEFREGIAGAVGRGLVGLGVAQAPLGHRGLDAVDQGADGDDGPGHHGQQHDDEVVPERLLMLVAIGGEALEIVFEEEFAEEGGVLVLHGDEPGQDDGEVEQHARPPERAPDDGPLAAQKGERHDDEDGQERRHRPFGQRGDAGEEVDIEEPEFRVGFIPRIPAEQADGEAGRPSAYRWRRRGKSR